MADLYQVYGGFAEEDIYENFENNVEKKRRKEAQPPVVQQPPPPMQPPPVVQPTHITQPTALSVPVSSHHSKESFQNMQDYKRYQTSQHYSFWDKMSMKRSDVIKLAIFSLVIVLAIAIDRIGTHYINKYLADNILTNFQEFMIRLAYPIVIVNVLWIIKSL